MKPPVARRLSAISAVRLPKADTFGKADPYLKLYLDGRPVGQTRHVAQTLDPVWDSGFELTLQAGAVNKPVIKVEVYDHDSTSAHDFLAYAEFRLDGDTFGLTTFDLLPGSDAPKGGLPKGCEVTLALEDPEKDLERTVILVEAAGLKAADGVFSGSSDPYSVVYCHGKECGKSPTVYSTLNPNWLAEVRVRVPASRGCRVRVELFDHDRVGDHDFLGQVRH